MTAGATVPARAQTPPSPPTTKGLLEQLLSQLLTPADDRRRRRRRRPRPCPPPRPPRRAAAPARRRPPPTEPDTSSQVIPAEYGTTTEPGPQRPRSTAALLDALRRLEDLGFTAEEAAVLGMGQFPVRGPGRLRPTTGTTPASARPSTSTRAPTSSPSGARPSSPPRPAPSRFTDGGLGGRGAYVTTDDGTSYYFAHLNAYDDSVYGGASVEQGQVDRHRRQHRQRRERGAPPPLRDPPLRRGGHQPEAHPRPVAGRGARRRPHRAGRLRGQRPPGDHRRRHAPPLRRGRPVGIGPPAGDAPCCGRRR